MQDGPVESCIAIGYNKEVKNGNERFDERRRPMEKYVRDSYTEHVQILSQSSLNGYKRLFGGQG